MTTIRSTLDGTRLAVEVSGSPAAPAVALVHAFPLTRASWDGVAGRLAGRARVVRYDQRGFGESGIPPGPYLMETLAADLADVLDAHGIARATIVGHSYGGYVASAFFRMFAERVTGLGFVTSRSGADDPASRARRLEVAGRIERDGAPALEEAMLRRYLAPEHDDGGPLLGALRVAMRAADPRGAAATLRGIAERSASDDLFDEMRVPVAVVAGERDRLCPLADLRDDAARIPGAVLSVLPSGHLPQWEAPERLGEALEALLDRVARAHDIN